MTETKNILITGVAGFIGMHISSYLLEHGWSVIGIDNMNTYYDFELKKDRLSLLLKKTSFHFYKIDLKDRGAVQNVFEKYCFDIVINLAAQAGVRYSIEHPEAYIESNVVGFSNLIELCAQNGVGHLLYASSSSVYGRNEVYPYKEATATDKPMSLYAATKKANEAIAYAYSNLYTMPTTGLRFFSVYGPYGRPDMAYFSFTSKIINGQKIKVFNHGDMFRDFTYIDDVVSAVYRLITMSKALNTEEPYAIYNIGNSKPEELTTLIQCIETELGIKAEKEYLPMQSGDVYKTFADISDLIRDTGVMPQVSLQDGIKSFVKWYKQYFCIKDMQF